MKKLIILTLFMGLTVLSLNAQKPQLETVGTYHYLQLPLNPLSENFSTYKIKARSSYGDLYRRDAIRKTVKVEGFDKKDADANDVDFIIEVEEYPTRLGDYERKDKVVTQKVDGVEKSTKYYWYVNTVEYKYAVKLVDKDGNILLKNEFGGTAEITGSENSSSSKAYDNYIDAKKKKLESLPKEQCAAISNYLNDQIGFVNKNLNVVIFKVKPKKHDYDDYDQAYNHFVEGFNIVAANEDETEEALAKLQPAIDLWEKALTESDVDDRKARINKKVTEKTYYNIGYAYFLVKNYDKAIEYFNKSEEMEGMLGSSQTYIKLCESRKKRAQANQ